MANRNEWVADRRLYLDKDGKAVEANDPSRATLLVAAGNTIPLEEAERLGLTKASQGPSENKLRQGPSENKISPMSDDEIKPSDDHALGLLTFEEQAEGAPGEVVQEDSQDQPPVVEFTPSPVFEEAINEPEPVKRGKRKE
jgi:hypothetical protein